MGKVRRCDKRCHHARGSRCRCWCGGFFHGKDGAGAANRAALAQGMTELLEQHGFKEGETAYIEQKELWIGATKAGHDEYSSADNPPAGSDTCS